MTRSVLAIAIVAILAGTTAAAQQPTARPDSAIGTTATTTNTVKKSTAAKPAAASKADQQFLKDFAKANAAEVEVGKLAAQKASHTEVKNFAKHMVDDHSKTLEKLQTLASTHNVDVKEAAPDPAHKEKATTLTSKTGVAFDEAYMKSMVEDHEKAVELLQKEIKTGKNANVKKLASEALPDVKKHLKQAKDLHELLAATTKSAADR